VGNNAKTGAFPLLKVLPERWLKNAESADLLGVTKRTIKNWMRKESARNALLAVRHGKQWRIPRPLDLGRWEVETRTRLEHAGYNPRKPYEQALEALGRRNEPYWRESKRLYFAAFFKALEKGRVTPGVKQNIDLMWLEAHSVLKARDQRTNIEMLKSEISPGLRRYWPGAEDFESV